MGFCEESVGSCIPEGACACGAEGHMASIGPPALGAKGCVERLRPTGETTHYDLCVAGAPANHVRCASLRSGGPPIGGQDNDGVSLLCSAPYTLLPLRGISPQGETRDMREKTASHILHVPLRHSPFGGWRHHLARWEACHLILSRLRLPANQVPLPPGGKHVTGFAGRGAPL